MSSEAIPAGSLAIRPAVPDDARGIARVFLESAEHHARLDAERYAVPDFNPVEARYSRPDRQHDSPDGEEVTFVADLGGDIAGFVDVRLDRPPDIMHRNLIYCHIVEIAVSSACRGQGIGARLLRTAEEWGSTRGAEFASLEYNAANTRAASFYTDRMGYRVAAHTAIKRL
ncbi:MAG: GNAT family N-acetyltransferase [Bryobacterales bacterium]|nr:GNAT family N-acetyltransferase [Bryobacterales bacterium]